MPITLESRVRRMQTINLPHEVFCRDACACTATTVVVVAENPRTGDRAAKRVTKPIPHSMTWLALERRAGLPSVLLEVPDVRAALACGDLRLVEQTPDVPPAATPAAAVRGSTTPAPAPAPSITGAHGKEA